MIEYVLFHNKDRHSNPSYWYGYYDSSTKHSCWSEWNDSMRAAVAAPLVPDINYESLDTFIRKHPDQQLLYRSTTPLNLDNHPELLL